MSKALRIYKVSPTASPYVRGLKLVYLGICRVWHHGHFLFNQKFRKFRNRGKWYGNLHKLLNFRKANHSTENSGNSGVKIKRNGNFQEKVVENLGISQELVLFFGKRVNLQFCIQHLFFWPRSQRVGHPRQRWRRRVFENGLIFYFRILPLVCRSILATAKFVKKAVC